MRSLILGLLVAGANLIGFEAIAYSKLSQKPGVNFSLTTKKSDICNTSIDKSTCSTTSWSKDINFKPDIEIQHFASVLLSQLTTKGCRNSHSIIKQNSICLTRLGGLPNKNIRRQLVTNATVVPQQPELTTVTNTVRRFPTLSRSSLIVTSPRQNKSLCASIATESNSCLTRNNDPLLINPAPKTTRIASPFGWRRRPYSGQLQFHHGVDYGAPLGTPVVAAGNGIVTKVVSGCADFGNKWCGGQFGNWIEIDHGNGAIAVYGHLLNKSISVTEGMKVWQNQEIAKVGSSGWSTGAHLDFRLKIAGKHQNPLDYIR